jgi:hypothetical protein
MSSINNLKAKVRSFETQAGGNATGGDLGAIILIE